MALERFYHPLPVPSADANGHYPMRLAPMMHLAPHPQQITDMMRQIHIPKEAVEFVKHEKAEEPREIEVHNDKHKFSVYLDIRHFKPEEVEVHVKNHTMIIEGRHDEREDDQGFVRRHFVRKYEIPKDVDPQAIQSYLHGNGVLTLAAPKKYHDEETEKGRRIPIAWSHNMQYV